MKIRHALAVKGYGGSFWKDEEAIKKGVKRDGFLYMGKPITPGFEAICQPSEAISIILILDDNRIAIGDCCTVTYSARAGRDPLFRSDYYIPFIREKILPALIGREITHFREMAEDFDSLIVDGKRLHAAIRYGVTQSLLDAVAQSHNRTMAEVISEEYGTKIADKPVRIFTQTGDDWSFALDRTILRRSEVFPHGNINNVEKLNKLSEYIAWTKKRVQDLTDKDFSPYLHYDLYGMLGKVHRNDIDQMVARLKQWQDIADPYKLIIEEPFDMNSQDEIIKMTHNLIDAKRKSGIDVTICADEWCNSFEDIQKFVDRSAAEMIQIKSPDLGGVNNIIDAILYCKAHGVYAYLGGSCCETDIASKVTWHVALATKPFQTLAKPGIGIDESYQIAMNEMNRALSLISFRKEFIN